MSQYPNQPPYQPGPGGQPPYQQPGGQPPYQQPGGYQPQPPYQQPGGQPPYQQPGGYPPQPGGQPPYQQQPPQYQQPPAAAQAVAKMAAPAPTVDNADTIERVTSLLAYAWLLFFGFQSLFSLTLDFGGRTFEGLGTTTSFSLNLAGLLGLVGPLAIMLAVKKGDLVKFHARQAFFLVLAYIVFRALFSLLYLINVAFVQDIILSGILVPGLQIIVAFAAIYAGIRAFYNKELFGIPVISSIASSKPAATPPPAYGGPR